jgi:hypothetical protein
MMKKVIFALAAALTIGTATTAFAYPDVLNSGKDG